MMINSINGYQAQMLKECYLKAYENRITQNAQNGNNPFGNGNVDIEWVASASDASSKNLVNTASAIKAAQASANTNETKTDVADTKEKSALSQTGSVIAQDFFNKITFGRGSIITKLTEVTPFTVASAILGIDLEEDGAALKEGAKTGKGGDYSEGYKKLFSRIDQAMENCVKDGSLKNVLGAFGQILSFIPNAGSTGITNTLKYIGAGLSKIGAPKIAEAIGSGVNFAGTILNSIGQGVVSSGKNLGGAIVSLVKGKPDQALQSLKNLGQDFKKMGIKIKDKFFDALNSGKELLIKGKDLVVKGFEKVKEKVKETVQTIVNVLNPLHWFKRRK